MKMGCRRFFHGSKGFLFYPRESFLSPLPRCSSHEATAVLASTSPKKTTASDTSFCIQNPYPFRNFQMGFSNSSCSSKNPDFSVESADEGSIIRSKQMAEDVETVCRILTRDPHLSSYTCFLDQSGVNITSELVSNVLKRLSNAGKLALHFFRWAEKQPNFKHSSESYHSLIDSLGKIKQFKLIWEIVNVMRDRGLLQKETFALISRRYVRAKNIREATLTFDRMRDFGLTADVSDFNSFLDTLSKSKNVKTAQEIFSDLKHRFSIDLKTYTILLEGWGSVLNLKKMTEVYKEMINDGFEPDTVTYGILIKGFARCRKLDEAEKLFQEMMSRKLKPSPHIYCTLINGLGSEKRLSDASKYFEMFKASGSPLDVPTCNAMIGSYCWAHKFEDAYKMVSEMREFGVGANARTFEVIIHHLVKAKRIEEARRVFRTMQEEAGCEPELNTYTIVVRMFCSEGRINEALQVWRMMAGKGIIPSMHMYSVIISGLQRIGRLEDASFYFQEMIERGLRPPARLYGDLKQALVDIGKGELAMQLGTKLEMLRTTPLMG
ncbi:tetratricopeptide repeat (TPR)-like superfamily protein [Wolffia australiana]